MTVQKELLQTLRDNGHTTDVMTCVMACLAASGTKQEEIISFLEEADAAGAAPIITFEAADGVALNIRSREENPMVDMLVQAIQNQNKEDEEK